MKYILLLLLLIPALVNAQVTTTLEGGGYFYLVVEGDTVSQHVQREKAISRASEHEGDWLITQDYRLHGNTSLYNEEIIIDEIIDTVRIPADTIIVQKTEMLNGIHDTVVEDGEIYHHEIRGEAFTDLLSFSWVCSGEEVGSYSDTYWEGGFFVSIPLDCQEDLTYRIHAESQVDDVHKKTSIHEGNVNIEMILGIEDPDMGTSYHTDFAEFDSTQWSQTWGDLEYEHVQTDSAEGELRVTLLERSIARLQWNEVPEHRIADYFIIEEIDSSHSTGFHIGLRTSQEPQQHAIETHLFPDGLGISIFQDGQWSNPETYPADWTYGEEWITEMQLREDYVRVRSYINGTTYDDRPEWNTYDGEEINAIPAGRFAIGSTGAGSYTMKEILVIVYD